MAIIMMPLDMVQTQGQHRCWTPIPQPPPLKAPSPGGKQWGQQPADNLWDQEWGSVPTQQWLTLPSWPQSSSSGSGVGWRPSWEKNAGNANHKATKTSRDHNEPRGCSAGEYADVPDDELPSIGSKGHAEGTCKRCAFFSKGRCQNGKDCSHCHYPHEERKRYRKRGQRAARDEGTEASAPDASGYASFHQAAPAEKDIELEELEEEEEEQLRKMMAQGAAYAEGYPPLCSPCVSAEMEADTAAPSGADTEDFETPRRSSAPSDCESSTPQRELPACPQLPGTPTRRKEPDSPTSSPAVSPLRGVEFDAAAEEVSRAARSLLNKLTAERFESISSQILALSPQTPAQLAALVSEVFRAATSQRSFLPLYAEVCQRLDAQLAEDASSTTGGKTFRKALVSECQASFEKHLQKARPDDEQLEGLGYEDRYAEEAALKSARLGNMRFIGELLVRRLIAGKVLLAIMNELLTGSEDDVESLLALLSVAGPHFDRKTVTAQSASVHETFKGLERRSTEKALSQRVRFQIRDLLEARERGWASQRQA